MKKSKDITKYEIEWQVLRVSLRPLKTVKEKVEKALTYLERDFCHERHERVYNYLQGLKMGCKSGDDRSLIQAELEFMKTLVIERRYQQAHKDFSDFEPEEISGLFKDLFIRNKNWLRKGYYQAEINVFMDELVKHCRIDKTIEKQISQLKELRRNSRFIENTHKWVFA